MWEMGQNSLIFAGFLPDFAVPPSFGVCINTFVGLYTQIFGGGGFCCTGGKDGGRFLCFLNR